jgi:Undecaprenyl-phosphate glucose phosphotransferase
MPYDTCAHGVERPQTGANRRGPLRPSQLKTARFRLSGDTLTRLVQLSDFAILCAFLLSGWPGGFNGPMTWLILSASVLTAAILVSFEAYQLNARERLHRPIFRVLGSVGGSVMLLLSITKFVVHSPEAVLVTVDWCLPVGALLCASHLAWFSYIRSLRRRGLLTPNLMIVGATPAAERLIAAALASRDVNILGIFDDRGARSPKHIFGVPVLGRTADIKSHHLLPYVDRVVVAVPSGATARIAQLIADLAPVPNAVSLLVADFDPASERDAHDRLLDMPLAHLSGARRAGTHAILKRLMDITFSIGGLIVLAPALVAIAIAIRLDSPGPILFKQRRHGYLNEGVVVWKFRSMKTELTDYTASRQITADDDRVTRVGGFLRRTSLDELPQLWNVIRGEMSLVGPRPHAIGMLTHGVEASKLVETYAHRHRMKPGLTGWAAVNGSRGPVDTAEAVRRRVSLDLEYVDRQSVWLDLAIIARTLPCVLGDTASVR